MLFFAITCIYVNFVVSYQCHWIFVKMPIDHIFYFKSNLIIVIVAVVVCMELKEKTKKIHIFLIYFIKLYISENKQSEYLLTTFYWVSIASKCLTWVTVQIPLTDSIWLTQSKCQFCAYFQFLDNQHMLEWAAFLIWSLRINLFSVSSAEKIQTMPFAVL